MLETIKIIRDKNYRESKKNKKSYSCEYINTIKNTSLGFQRFKTPGGETEKDVPAAPPGHFDRRDVRQPKFFQDMP